MDEDRVDELVRSLYQAKQRLDEAALAHGVIEAQLIEALDATVRSLQAETHDSVITANVIRGTRIVIDEARLRKELGAQQWKRVTSPVLDKSKLEASIALGDVDPTVVAMCSDEKVNKPYFRFKVKTKRTVKPRTAARKIRRS